MARKVLTQVLLVLAVAATAATAGCGLGSTGQMTVRAVFPDSVGLYQGNDVQVLGIKVGTVTRIVPSGTHVLVDLAIDRGVKIPANAGAVTVAPSVVTDRRVELTPVYRGGPTLRDGDLIPLDRTRTPVNFDRVLAAADRLSTQLAAVQNGQPVLSDAVATAARTFQGKGDKLRTTLHGLATTVGIGADQRDQLVNLIKDADHLSQVAAANDATIRSFSTNLTEATELLDQQGPALVQILDQLNELTDRTEALLRDNRGKFNDNVDNLRVTAATADRHTRELAESIDVIPTLFENLARIPDPQRRRARVHASLDQVLFDSQLPADVCRRYGVPALCAADSSGRQTDAGLGQLFLGGAR
jgi:virulence factor Mce-like protein